ncbi:MAG: mechanosensitive ion channel domain-containing protein [Salibacteraceae bacterium]
MEQLIEILNTQLFKYKSVSLTLMDIGVVILIYIVTGLLLRVLKFAIARNVRSKTWMEKSTLYAINKLSAYFAYTISTGIALEVIGLDLTILLAGSAALLVGVGLGIQQIFNDFTSGLIILFGGTVKVGDIVEFDNTVGRITAIDFRTSHIETRDSITIIVPNSQLVSDIVINWSAMQQLTRFRVDVGVAYGSDTELVSTILKDVAANHELVNNDKPVSVQFKSFGDSSLDFSVLFWTTETWKLEVIRSDIRFEIDRQFRKHGVRIPFPQRDVHFYPNKE